uniref:Putative tail protein n=1 Tax=viral metagenome TaxID=1070528 RepID=A0A6M3IZ42_9ZZZZ
MSRTDQDELIKIALITANREIANLGALPLAWNIEVYDEIFTRYHAVISAITAANPGVITADSVDPDLFSDHGFQTNDIVYLEGINGAEQAHKLNNRLFRAVRASSTTISLKSLNGNTAINTTDYPAYDSGGTIYHAGIVLPASTIEPSGASDDDVNYEWDIKRVYDVQFDLYSADPVSEESAKKFMQSGGRPKKWRYQQYAYGTFATPEHLLFWYNFTSQRYNVTVHIEKQYPDLADWSDSVYPPCPDKIHDYIWHRALSNLAMDSQKHRRKTKDAGDNTKVEVLNAQYWMMIAAQDELDILEYSNKLSGKTPYMSKAMEA